MILESGQLPTRVKNGEIYIGAYSSSLEDQPGGVSEKETNEDQKDQKDDQKKGRKDSKGRPLRKITKSMKERGMTEQKI